MIRREVAHVSFTEALTDDEVFIGVYIIDEFVEVLLTGRHHGDIDVNLDTRERSQVVEALEKALSTIRGVDSSVEQEIARIRHVRAGSKLEQLVNVNVEKGLIILDLALEGDENEEDRVWVYLTAEQCAWLIEALIRAEI
jgi:hypothetical protein